MSQSFKSSEYSTSSDPRLLVLMGSHSMIPLTWSASFLQAHHQTLPSIPSQLIGLTSGSKRTCQYQKLLPLSYASIFDQSPSLQYWLELWSGQSYNASSIQSSCLSPPPTLTFSNQFVFYPTGSPTAAIISILNIVTNMLLANPYVIVIALDFSMAFDMVRHSTLL